MGVTPLIDQMTQAQQQFAMFQDYCEGKISESELPNPMCFTIPLPWEEQEEKKRRGSREELSKLSNWYEAQEMFYEIEPYLDECLRIKPYTFDQDEYGEWIVRNGNGSIIFRADWEYIDTFLEILNGDVEGWYAKKKKEEKEKKKEKIENVILAFICILALPFYGLYCLFRPQHS